MTRDSNISRARKKARFVFKDNLLIFTLALVGAENMSYERVQKYAFCNKRSHGSKSAILEGKLIIIPALGH